MDSVASRYAIALLNIAREERKIKEYVDEVEQIGNLLSQNKDLLTLLKDYGLSTIEKKNLLTSIFENKISEYILNLLYVSCTTSLNNVKTSSSANSISLTKTDNTNLNKVQK